MPSAFEEFAGAIERPARLANRFADANEFAHTEAGEVESGFRRLVRQQTKERWHATTAVAPVRCSNSRCIIGVADPTRTMEQPSIRSP